MANCKYGNVIAEVENAAGVSGILIRSGGKYYFRVPTTKGSQEFIDYEIRHDDLAVTIDEGELASFYIASDLAVLDHSPEVLAKVVS